MKSLIALITLLSLGRLSALNIVVNFAGGDPPANLIGTNDLLTACRAAADFWELAIEDDFTLTIDVKWGHWDSGSATVQTTGFDGQRVTRSTIIVVNDSPAPFPFWCDPTPWDASECGPYTEKWIDAGAGPIVGARFYGPPVQGSDSWTGVDILGILLVHEMGHALGMEAGLFGFYNSIGPDGKMEIKAPLPFAGIKIPIDTHFAHIASGFAWNSVMGDNDSYSRRLPSMVDILCVCQASGFTKPNLNLLPKLYAADNGLSWSAHCKNYTLQESHGFSGPWSPIPAVFTFENGRYVAQWPPTDAMMFYRLSGSASRLPAKAEHPVAVRRQFKID